ncbi:hypothetical protein [Streptomyces mirabilis]|uniref:hypothetical protein n=1 Tax=Streptomyces mirabilis TaxID=68239 RepID=UPI0036A576C8
MDRKPSSRRRRLLKARLAERDGASYWYCGAVLGPGLDGATIDHLVPRSVWHTWMQAALVLACGPGLAPATSAGRAAEAGAAA